MFLTLLGDPVVGILLLGCMLGTEESYTDGLEVGILLLGLEVGILLLGFKLGTFEC